MKKSFILFASLALASTFASADQFRVVVSQDKAQDSFSSSVSNDMLKSTEKAAKTTCLMTTDGLREICVPTPSSMKNGTMSKSASVKSFNNKYTMIAVDADNINQVVDTLKNTGWYNSVEIDVPVSTIKKPAKLSYSSNSVSSQSLEEPNDPDYDMQTYLHSEDIPGLEGRVHSNITKARNSVINKTAKIGIAVLDSGFDVNEQFEFNGGYSFVTSFGNERNGDYNIADRRGASSCGMHGLGVASSILAAIDDGKFMAGIINDVDSYAMRVMQCGTGYIHDSAAALNYLAKKEVDGVDELFTGDVQVANISLGGKSDTCPNYLQEAIDNANEAGITVVVAAGNDTADVSNYTPANCSGVIVVGATTAHGELAGFSNFGDKVSISAQGVDVAGLAFIHTPGTDSDGVYGTGYWEGTSFSAPLVTGAIALAKLDAPSLSTSTMRWLTKTTAMTTPDLSGECAALGCGTGTLDAYALLLAAQKAEQGELSSIHHALSDKSTCDQQWYIDYFGDSGRLCSMYKVNFFNELTDKDTEYQLLRAEKGSDLELGDSILSTSSSSLLVQDIDTALYDYGFKVCTDGVCSKDTYKFKIDAEKMAMPAACN